MRHCNQQDAAVVSYTLPYIDVINTEWIDGTFR